MAACAVKRGIIALRDCGEEGVNTCSVCARPACAEHTRLQSGNMLCVECYAKQQEAAGNAPTKRRGATGRVSTRSTPKGEVVDEDPWADPSYPYAYRHHYYSSYGYSPLYTGSYYDSYYDDYDLRSFDQAADEAGLDDDAPDAGGFYDS